MDVLIAIFLLSLMLLSIPKLMGFRTFVVTSGSMEPYLPIGSLTYVKKEASAAIDKGDVITFTLGETVVTHRVEQVLQEGRSFVTKGDANEERDYRPVGYEQILGTVQFFLPGLGYAGFVLGTTEGRIAAAVLFLWMLFMEAIASDAQNRKERKECKKNEKQKDKTDSDICGRSHAVYICGRCDRSIPDPVSGNIEKYDYAGKH